MSNQHKPRKTTSRRALLGGAVGGTIAAVGGLAAFRAEASTTPKGPKQATNQPNLVVAPAAALVTQGLDYAWSKPSPSAIKSAGYNFVCRYLSYDTTGKNLTASEAQALSAAGIDIVCNWEYSATEALQGYNKGVSSAQTAQSQALACGMPADRPIYFSVDFDATPSQQTAINSYLDGVASVLGRGRTGAYGGYYPIKRAFDAGKITWGWQTYAWSGGQWDSRAQLRQVQNGITVGGADCDKDQAWADDYGQWGKVPSGPLLTVANNADGRLQVFVERSGSIVTASQNTVNGSFSSLSSLGGAQLSANVQAALNADGRLQLFVNGGDGTVYSKWQASPGGAFGDWFSLGASQLRSLAVGVNQDKRMQMFAVGGDGILYDSWQTTPNGSFSGWASLAGAQLGGTVTTAMNPDGKMHVFVLGGDGLVYSKVQTAANGSFSDWVDHGGSALRSLAVGANPDGRLELFGTGVDGALYTSFQTSVNGNFGSWYNLAGAQLSATVCAASNADGRLQVFVLGGDGTVYSKVQATPNGSMGDWVTLGAVLLRSLRVGVNADKRLQLFAVGGDGVLYTSVQGSPNGSFGGWTSLG